MENVQIFELLLTHSLIIKYNQMITSRLKLQKKRKFTKFVNEEDKIFLPD